MSPRSSRGHQEPCTWLLCSCGVPCPPLFARLQAPLVSLPLLPGALVSSGEWHLAPRPGTGCVHCCQCHHCGPLSGQSWGPCAWHMCASPWTCVHTNWCTHTRLANPRTCATHTHLSCFCICHLYVHKQTWPGSGVSPPGLLRGRPGSVSPASGLWRWVDAAACCAPGQESHSPSCGDAERPQVPMCPSHPAVPAVPTGGSVSLLVAAARLPGHWAQALLTRLACPQGGCER